MESYQSPFWSALLSNCFIMFLTFSVALSFVDPLTRRFLEASERRRWDKVGATVTKNSKQAVQSLIVQCLVPLYSYVSLVAKVAPDEAPELKELFYHLNDSSLFLSKANKMLDIVGTYLIHDDILTRTAEMSSYLDKNDVFPNVHQKIDGFEKACLSYSTAPLPNPKVLNALSELRASTQTLLEISISVNSLPELAKGIVVPTMRLVVEKALSTYVELHSSTTS